MRALSIRQPWANLILERKKKIEVRPWYTKFRGYFLIHSSKNPDLKAMKFFNFDPKKFLYGYIIGYAKLKDVVTYNHKEEFWKDKEKHLSISEDRKYPTYGFILEDVQKIKPIPYKGQLGFFKVPEINSNDLGIYQE